MSGRPSREVMLAVKLVLNGHTVTAAAMRHGVAMSSVRRALRAQGIAPLAPGRPLVSIKEPVHE